VTGCVGLASPGVAGAFGAQLDTATANGDNVVTDDYSATDIVVDAHSGPSGEDPGGHVSFNAGGMVPISGPVTCLDVSGNTAVMTVDGPFASQPEYSAYTVRVVDNGGSGVDRFEYFPVRPEMPVDCRTGSATYFGGALVGRAIVKDVSPPVTITAGPSGVTNDPTPTFAFSSAAAGASFQCKLDSAPYAACTSPHTVSRLADGARTFYVRAIHPGVPPTPAIRTFTVRTASVREVGSVLAIDAAPGARDNLVVTHPTPGTLRVSDLAGGAFTGSGLHTGTGCAPVTESVARCAASGITRIRMTAADRADRVLNSTGIKSSAFGGGGDDTEIGGWGADTLAGGAGSDSLKGMNGDDLLVARDHTSDAAINCDGGNHPGTADGAELDPLPLDPNSAISGCEVKARR
jgi:hypothetical protein